MGLFGRKPRMVGFGDPKAQKKAAPKHGPYKGQHTGQDHRRAQGSGTAQGPWKGAQGPNAEQAERLQAQLSELRKKSPALGRIVEGFASGGPGGADRIASNISRIVGRWVMIGVVIFFVLPFVSTLLMVFLGG